MNQIKNANAEDHREDDYKILKKSLGFIISVAAVEDKQLLDDISNWIKSNNKYWNSIIKSNLKKNRLKKKYPEKSDQLLNQIV